MTPVPLMSWDEQVAFRGDCVWWTRLDDRYQIEVHRTGEPHHGLFLMWDRTDDMKLVAETKVGLAYDAVFGPDAMDVHLWESMGIDVADGKVGATEEMAAPLTKEDAEPPAE